jgi:hypothetical protein
MFLFSTASRPVMGPSKPPPMGAVGCFCGSKAAVGEGRELTTHLHLVLSLGIVKQNFTALKSLQGIVLN